MTVATLSQTQRIIRSFAMHSPYFPGKGRLVSGLYKLVSVSEKQEFEGGFLVQGRTVRFSGSLQSTIEGSALMLGAYEPGESRVLDRFVRPDELVLDIGANVGLHTLRCAALGASVIAFEPNPEVRARLLKNLDLNGLSSEVDVRDVAVGDAPGYGTLYVNDQAHANRNATMVDDSNPDVGRVPVRVPIVRLDDLSFSKPVNFVKIDIEGFELAALRGGVKLIRQCKPVVMLEYNKHFAEQLNYGLADLIEIFQGYNVFTVNVRGALNPPDCNAAFATILFVPG